MHGRIHRRMVHMSERALLGPSTVMAVGTVTSRGHRGRARHNHDGRIGVLFGI